MSGMNFAAAASKVRTLLAAPKHAQRLSTSALTQDSLRDHVVRDAIGRSERFQSAVERTPSLEFEADGEQRSTQWDSFGDCLTDFARASFGFDEPELLPADRIRPSHRLNREALAGALGSKEFQQDVRPYTRANEDEATLSALAYADALTGAAQMHLAEHAARSQQMGEQEQAEADAEARFEQLRAQAKQEVGEQGEVGEQTRREIKQALKAGEQAREELGELIAQANAAGATAAARKAGRVAAQQAGAEVQAWNDLPDICKGKGQGWGTQAGPGMKLDPDVQLELAKMWAKRPHLQRIAKLLGRRIRNMAKARKTRVHGGRGVVVGVETGDNLHKLLPRELARACSGSHAVRTMFVKDYVEKNLLQYRTQVERPAAKGDIICVLDGSDSMRGERREWAGSVELALLAIAQREKRGFAAVHFGSAHQLQSWTFKRGEPVDPHTVLAVAEQFFAGGTDIATGMAEALRIYQSEPGFKTADVVLITDGICGFGDKDKRIRDELRRLGVRIHGISIRAPRNAYMNEMCEMSVDVTDLADDEAANKIAANLT